MAFSLKIVADDVAALADEARFALVPNLDDFGVLELDAIAGAFANVQLGELAFATVEEIGDHWSLRRFSTRTYYTFSVRGQAIIAHNATG